MKVRRELENDRTAPVGRIVAELIPPVKAFQHGRKTGEGVPWGWQAGQGLLG
jgi:alkyl hydroperoxide reductase subunit AhpC